MIENDPDGDFNSVQAKKTNKDLRVKKFSQQLENQMNEEDVRYKEIRSKNSADEKGRVAQELVMAAAYYVNEDKKKPPKRSCLCIFKLETGIVAIVYLDIMMLMIIFSTTTQELVQLSDTVQEKTGHKAKGKASLF